MKKSVNPRMHTAEHVLNQTMVRMFGCDRCFSAHIEKKKSKCDYHVETAPTDKELKEVEERVNEVIRADMPVTEAYASKAECETLYSLERLPEEAGDEIRIVRVGDYDACPCIGAHVSSTGEIGRFRMVSSSYENGVLRIRYKLAAPDKKPT